MTGYVETHTHTGLYFTLISSEDNTYTSKQTYIHVLCTWEEQEAKRTCTSNKYCSLFLSGIM